MINNEYVINLINNRQKIDNQLRLDNPQNINNQLTISYKKNIHKEEQDDYLDYNQDENDIIYDVSENEAKNNIERINLKLFIVVSGVRPTSILGGIWTIKYIPNTSTSVVRFGNATSILPISNTLIYTVTATSQPNYPIRSVYRGTYSSFLTNQNFGTPLFQADQFDGEIYAIERDSANNIYIGGRFQLFIKGATDNDNLLIQNLGKWDPTTSKWSLVNGFTSPNPNESIMAIAISGSNIYLGGNFTTVNYRNQIGKLVSVPNVSGFVFWNNSFGIWSTENIRLFTQSGATASVYVMKFSRGSLYLGGNMFSIGYGNTNIRVNNIFSIDENRIPRLLQQGTSSDVYTIDADSAGNLYVGGSFISVNPNGNNLIVRYIARWVYNNDFAKRKWQQIISAQGPTNNRIGLNQPVYAIAVDPLVQTRILVGGLFYRDRKRTDGKAPATISYIASFNTRNRLWTGIDWRKTIPGQ